MEIKRKNIWVIPVFLLFLALLSVSAGGVAEAVLLDTCISTGGGDVCNDDVCINGKCDAGGQDCTVDADCRFCTISFRPCASGCADEPDGTALGVCSVSKLLCDSDTECRPSVSVYNGCMQDVYQQVGDQTQTLNCTANDISIAETSILTVIDACEFPGDFGTVQLQADLLLTAQARHDIGIYLAVDGGDALVGTCLGEIVPLVAGVADLDGILDDTSDNNSFGYCSGDGSALAEPPLACSDMFPCPAGQTCVEFGPGIQDTCGDIDDANNPITGIPLSPITLPCIDKNGDGQADLPSCLSWRQPGSNELCLMPLAAYPGAPSKCNCQILDIPLGVPKSLEVVKELIPGTDTGLFDLQIDSVTLADDVGDGGTTGRQDVSDGECTLDGNPCTKDSDCDGGLNSVAGGDVCEPYDRTVGETAGTDTDLGDYSTDISCVSRLGTCSGDPTFVCSLDTAVPDPCVVLDIGTCTGDPVVLASCTDCTTIPVAIEREQTDILCTITNTLVVGTLKLVKTVTNDDGGTAVPADWTLTATGDSRGFSDSGDSTTFHKVTAGVAYTLSESSMPGYEAGSWSCDGGTQIDDQITVTAGQAVTCTINNDDIAPTLKLVKTVTNDDGGTKQPSDWTLTATGDGGFSDSGDSTTFHTVKAGVGYVLSESSVSGYTAGDWSCDGGTLSGSTVTLGLDEAVTCTINNDDQTAHLTLVKTVTNDNGGNAVATDWTLSASGPTPISGPGGADSDVEAGTYTLSESGGPAGYTASAWSCVGGTQSGASITLALGESATCTINNNDIAPTLTLIKTVINDNGGTLQVSDFPLFIDGGSVTSGVANQVTANVQHTATETTQTGYAPSAWGGDCAADGTVTLLPGENKTCTITNDDIAPTLTVIKYIINSTGPDTGKFNLQIDSVTYAADVGDSGTTGAVAVTAGVQHTAGETAGTGTSLDDYVTVIGGDCASDGTITLALAENKTCTITNTAKGMVEVYKTTSGIEPGEGFDFEIRTGASTESSGTVIATCTTDAAGFCDFGETKFEPGDYQFCEVGMMPGWSNDLDGFTPDAETPEGGDNSSECVNFTLDSGETEVFNIDNTPPPGGDARTIGFWKNWTSCDGHGNQDPVLDETLVLFASGVPLGSSMYVTNCQDAVNILNKSTLTGDNKANDAAYSLAAQLLAAELNIAAGAGTCPEVMTAGVSAQALLSSIGFDGTGDYLGPKVKGALKTLRLQALVLAETLDAYNNNMLCP